MYKYVEFPRAVYGPDGASTIINSEDERPEGYTNIPGGGVEEDTGTKDEVKARKDIIRVFLDKHKVEYSPQLGIVKLEELHGHLETHLKEQAEADEAAAALAAATAAATPEDDKPEEPATLEDGKDATENVNAD